MRPWQQALIDNPPQLDYGTDSPDPSERIGSPMPIANPVIPRSAPPVGAPVGRPFVGRPVLQRPVASQPRYTPQMQSLIGQKVLERILGGFGPGRTYNGANNSRLTLADLIEFLSRR